MPSNSKTTFASAWCDLDDAFLLLESKPLEGMLVALRERRAESAAGRLADNALFSLFERLCLLGIEYRDFEDNHRELSDAD